MSQLVTYEALLFVSKPQCSSTALKPDRLVAMFISLPESLALTVPVFHRYGPIPTRVSPYFAA